MNLQQVLEPRFSANGYGRQKITSESEIRLEHKLQSEEVNPSKLTNTGVLGGSEGARCESPARERLVYITACLVGHNVEVQVKDGSLYSGIFHATNAEDFGIVLKMACSIKVGPSPGQESISNCVGKAPSKTLIIPARELVQITAKDVSVNRDGFANDLQGVNQEDLMIDSFISQSHHIDLERTLERWVPGEDDPECPELEDIFDGPWNRGWDQFEANETLFGVTSTFDEELYTTKLERGPKMKEFEKEASRIAREIEGEKTEDLHLAEERGIHLHDNLDIDEETRFSSVFRGVDDSGYDGDEGLLLGSHNTKTFYSAPASSVSGSFADMISGKSDMGTHLSCSSSMDEVQWSLPSSARDLRRSSSIDHCGQLSSQFLVNSMAVDGESRIQENQFSQQHAENNYIEELIEQQALAEEAQRLIPEDSQSFLGARKDGSSIGRLSPNATLHGPASVGSIKGQEKMSFCSELYKDAAPLKIQEATNSAACRGLHGSSRSSASGCGGAGSASSGPGLSPTSSVASFSSEKSTLNPHAKEFKLNPNAKSFIPSQSPRRPASPASDGPLYRPTNIAAPHMHGMPVIGPSFSHQPVIFNPQFVQMQPPQSYFNPNGPQYGQQLFLGHPQPVIYMPAYPPEMPDRGRDL